jgi:LPS-assembly protein
MLYKRKVTAKYILQGLIMLLLVVITFHIDAKDRHFKGIFKSLTNDEADTVRHTDADTTKRKSAGQSILAADTAKKDLGDTLHSDTIKKVITDTLTFSKDSLDAPVQYKAEDSAVLVIPTKQFYLYGKANTVYKDLTLDANTIQYDQETQLITAFGGTDTGHNPLNLPKMKQGQSESVSDTIKFNMKNQRGLTKNTFYKEGEMFVHAEVVKKIDANTEYAYKGRFTTCNLDTPHFAFVARKMKIVNNKIAVTGPAIPEFEGVPLPIVIPFGIFPLERGRHSGILAPAFINDFSKGLGLQGLGYYKVLNDNWDVTVRSDIYTYGGWTMDIKPDYFKRYAYRGTLDLSIQKTKILNTSGLATNEFTENQTFFITWSHSTDQRARPGTTFSANVRAGSTKYNRLQTSTSFRNYDNQLASSITYGKTWDNGKYNLSVAANHNQNNNLGLINIQAPSVNFTATTIYPFQKKDQVGTPKWYQKLGISYTGTALNQFAFYDSIFNFKKLLDTALWGIDHRIPISLTLPAFGPFLASPSVSYEERWYGQQTIKTWDAKNDTLLTRINRGFYTAREVSFGFSVNTRIFGTYKFKSGKVTAIRHEVKPYISLNYKPNLAAQYFRNVQVDKAGDLARYSTLDGGVIGSFSEGKFGGMSFGVDNLLEMKVKDKSDTSADGTKKVRLLDGFGFTGGYNFIADSLQWSPVSLTVRSTLFGNVNITGGATIDPYGVDSFGKRINKLLWGNGSLGRFTGGNLAISTSLKSKSKDAKKDADRVKPDATLTPDEQQRQLDYVRQNPSEFVDFNIPWSLQLSLAVNFSRLQSANLRNYYTQINSNLNVNGDFSLSPKWKIGGGTYFDFKALKIQAINMFLTREMHCWQMSINVQLGTYKSFSIVINPKSGILRDLKINRTRSFTSY